MGACLVRTCRADTCCPLNVLGLCRGARSAAVGMRPLLPKRSAEAASCGASGAECAADERFWDLSTFTPSTEKEGHQANSGATGGSDARNQNPPPTTRSGSWMPAHSTNLIATKTKALSDQRQMHPPPACSSRHPLAR
jgi:hypothetical protein